jgi:transposase
VTVDPRDQRIAELEALVLRLLARIDEQDKRIAALETENRELKARLNQNSTNSSKPPSSDPPGTQRPSKTPSGRRPGGQPGHKHHKRELIPSDQVDKVVNLSAPDECGRCHAALRGGAVEALRHQLVEVPPLKPVVTEFRCHGRECRGCGAVTYAALPPEADGHVFGERLTAIVAVLAGKYRLSKRLIQSALSDLLGVRISLGAVSNRDADVSAALGLPMAEAEAFVRNAEQAHADETGWSEGKSNGKAKRAWLWVVATAMVTVFRTSSSRGSEVAKALLGEDFIGFLITDRWCAYNWYDLGLRQLCWSHLTRDFQSFIDRGGEGARIGALLMAERDKMFRWWHRVRDGTLTRRAFERRMQMVERRVGRLLRDAVVRAEPKTAGMAEEILKLEMAMWTFVGVEGLEPTNNFGERTIRPAVMYRKTSFGTQSPEGSRFVERVLTTVATLKQQKRNALEFLTDAIHAHRCRLPPPSLLPMRSGQLAITA